MTWKTFKKFGWIKGQVLSEKYNIILTNHETTSEKALRLAGKFNITNINLGIAKFNKGMQQFNQLMGSKNKPTKERKSKSRASRIREHNEMDFGLGPAPKLNMWGKQEKFKLSPNK